MQKLMKKEKKLKKRRIEKEEEFKEKGD